MITVTFLPAHKSVSVEPGSTVIQAARLAGLHVNASCGGAGVCGKCRVRMVEGEFEGGLSEKIPAAERDQGIRQACTTVLLGDCTVGLLAGPGLDHGQLGVEVPQRHRAAMHSFDLDELRESGLFVPPVEKFYLELPRPTAGDHQADAGRLIRSLREQYGEKHIMFSLEQLRRLRRVLREDDFRVTATLARPVNRDHQSRLMHIQAGNWTARNFGLAVDVGTTTVYAQLIDLESGQVLAEAGEYNRQVSYGEDVISRMIFAEQPEGLRRMHELARDSINAVCAQVLDQAQVARDEVTTLTLAGNTAMTHLLLQLEPHNIRRAPYVPVTTLFPPMRAVDMGLDLAENTMALVYPNVSSYVGGDIVAGVMGSGMYRTDRMTLFIDIGTNAEIVIGNREWLACAACSAGPAFEGGGIQHGMRAADGAIEDFSLDPATLEPMVITIGGRPARGICGSGLLLIIASLFTHGLLDQRGRFVRESGNARIREGASGHEYVLVWNEDREEQGDIVLTEVDIDNFIRAKGAIHAGVSTLLAEVGLGPEDLEQVILAGAFGSYIDLDAAMTVGLLPELDPGRIMYVGNGSLMGCRMSALSNHIRRDVVAVLSRMTGFELSEVPAYKDHYVASLFLPHTDESRFPQALKRRRDMLALGNQAA